MNAESSHQCLECILIRIDCIKIKVLNKHTERERFKSFLNHDQWFFFISSLSWTDDKQHWKKWIVIDGNKSIVLSHSIGNETGAHIQIIVSTNVINFIGISAMRKQIFNDKSMCILHGTIENCHRLMCIIEQHIDGITEATGQCAYNMQHCAPKYSWSRPTLRLQTLIR